MIVPYGKDATITIPLVLLDDTNFADVADYTPAAADCQQSIDGGTFAQCDNTLTLIDNATASVTYGQLVVSAAELTGKYCVVQLVDAALEHQMVTLYTCGHPSAFLPWVGIIGPDSGTLAAASAGGGTLATSAVDDANYYDGSFIHIPAGQTGGGQTREMRYGASRAFTVEPDWDITPTGSLYYIIPAPPGYDVTLPDVNVEKINNVQITGDGSATPFNV